MKKISKIKLPEVPLFDKDNHWGYSPVTIAGMYREKLKEQRLPKEVWEIAFWCNTSENKKWRQNQIWEVDKNTLIETEEHSITYDSCSFAELRKKFSNVGEINLDARRLKERLSTNKNNSLVLAKFSNKKLCCRYWNNFLTPESILEWGEKNKMRPATLREVIALVMHLGPEKKNKMRIKSLVNEKKGWLINVYHHHNLKKPWEIIRSHWQPSHNDEWHAFIVE